MKKLSLKISFFLLTIIIVYSISYLIIPRELYQIMDYKYWVNTTKRINDFSKNNFDSKVINNIVLGDSRSQYGFNAKKNNAVNFSIGATTPVEGYYYLKNILNITKLDTVYISYGPFHIFHQDYFFYKTTYYNFVEDDFISSIINKAKEVGDENYRVNLLNNRTINVFDYIYHKTGSLKQSKYAMDFYEYFRYGPLNMIRNLVSAGISNADNKLGYERSPGANRVLGENTKNIFTKEWEFEKKGLEDSEINIIYLELMIDLCKKNNIEYYFIVLPIPQNSIKPDNKYFEKYFDILNSRFGKRVICDTMFYPNKYFQDESHLNDEGVEYFSNKVKGILVNKTIN
ncbi:MAG: hypothetical protein V1773_13310 [bacterium]